MSSIPLPALAGQAPQQPDTLGNFQRLLAIKNAQAMAPLQQQEAKQNIQSSGLQIQQQQMQVQDQQKIRQAFMDSQGDMDKFYDTASRSGVSPQTLIGIKNSIVEQKQKLATLTKDQLGNVKAQNEAVGQATGAVLALPPEQRKAALLNNVIPGLAQQGVMKPEEAQQYAQQISQADDASIEQLLKVHQYSAMAADKQIGEIFNAQKNPIELEKSKTQLLMEKAKAKFYQNSGVVPGVPAEDQQMADWLKKNPGKGPSDYQIAMKKVVPAFNFNLQANGVNGGGGVETADAKGNPRPIADVIKDMGPKGGTVQAIIDGRQKAPASFAQKSPYWQDVMNKVYQIDPQFNEQRAELRKAYTVPQGNNAATQINAINTAMGHVGVLGDAITALDNGNIPLLNKIANGIGVQVGSDAKTTFQTIVHRVGPELSKAYIGAGGSAGERGTDEADFDPNKGTQQLKSNVAITAKLLRSKIASLENQWDQNKAPGMKSFEDQFIMPEARAQLDKWSPKSAAQSNGGSEQHAPGAKAGLQEGATGTGSDGQKYIVKGGVWVRQ